MFPQLQVLPPARQKVCDPPAGRVRHSQLGELVQQSWDDGIKGATEIFKQHPGTGSCGVLRLENEVHSCVYCSVYKLVSSLAKLQALQEWVSDGGTAQTTKNSNIFYSYRGHRL